jgi:hypothetical protein
MISNRLPLDDVLKRFRVNKCLRAAGRQVMPYNGQDTPAFAATWRAL